MIYFDYTCEPGLEPDKSSLVHMASKKLSIPENEIAEVVLDKRSLDARKKPVYKLRFQVRLNKDRSSESSLDEVSVRYSREINVSKCPPVIIAGSGPTGLFAALSLIHENIRPIIIERGKPVRERRHDLAQLMKYGVLNQESNYCFGEGGAGTFSDGKLYTRSHKRGRIIDILKTFIHFGARSDIGVDAHPHIGTNKLPDIINNIRDYLIRCGAEIHFNTRLESLIIKNKTFKGARTTTGDIEASAIILATGHSATDIYEMLHSSNIQIQPKGFAIGVRIEHPQIIINKIQYKNYSDHPALPPASYQLVTQAMNRGVYSFCMCPGGIICPASTQEGQLVVNGWSPSRRNSPFANSGMVVEIPGESIPGINKSPLAGLEYQASIEKKAFIQGGGKYQAPAQRLNDFLRDKISGSLPKTSYKPGTRSSDLREVLPTELHSRLKEGLAHFAKIAPLYGSDEAVLVGVESRTSSPIRIPREENGMHPDLCGLFPAGEGAGYAGGIVSAALDGVKSASLVKKYLY